MIYVPKSQGRGCMSCFRWRKAGVFPKTGLGRQWGNENKDIGRRVIIFFYQKKGRHWNIKLLFALEQAFHRSLEHSNVGKAVHDKLHYADIGEYCLKNIQMYSCHCCPIDLPMIFLYQYVPCGSSSHIRLVST